MNYPKLVLFGLDADNSVKTDEVFRFIILFVKHYIYQCKRNMSLCVDIFQKQLQLRYKVKEYNAKILSRDLFFLIIKAGVVMKPYYQNRILNFALPYIFK